MAYEIQRPSAACPVLGTEEGQSVLGSYRGLLWLGVALVLIPYVFWAARLFVLSKMGVYR
jgi:hypothetical protein